MFGLGIMPKVHRAVGLMRNRARGLAGSRSSMPDGAENLAVLFSEPHDMPMGDRIVLYGLIRGLKPAAYLEIGVRWGGSARIVASAMAVNGAGAAVGLDPDLSNFRPSESELAGRYTLIKGYSPEDTGTAVKALEQKPDFVFIDAVHTYSAVKEDIRGVLPHLADTAHLLFHDAFHQGINQAVDEFLAEHSDFTDHGMVSKNPEVGLPVSYGGLRLVKRGGTGFPSALAAAHAGAGMAPPELSPEVWDHDPYANRIGNPLGRPDKG